MLLGIYAFAFQIYCDFSGYTDIARGIAKLLGFELVRQLPPALLRRQPQRLLAALAHQPVDLAARLPLHPARRQPRRRADATYRNLMLTMLLGGLWHGASWTFVALGRLPRPASSCVDRVAGAIGDAAATDRPARPGRRCVVVTFHLVCFGWLFFRADDFADGVGACCRRMVTALHADGATLRRRCLASCCSARCSSSRALRSTATALAALARGAAGAAGAPRVRGLAPASFLLGGERRIQFIYFQF